VLSSSVAGASGWGLRDGSQVGPSQAAHVLGDQVEHALVLTRGSQSGGDGRPGRPGHRLHSTPLPQFLRRHAVSSHPTTWPLKRSHAILPDGYDN
jgi:hypothetical protein